MTKNAQISKSLQSSNISHIKSTQSEMINRYLLSIDSLYLNLEFTAGMVVVYCFENEWIEMNFEGALYLYKRNDLSHRLVILNRNGPSDFKLNIPSEFYVEYQTQFVTFSHLDRNNIFGLWFENEFIAKKLFQKLQEIQNS